MVDLVRTEYLRLIIEAQNRSTAAFRSAAVDATGLQATIANVGKGMVAGGVAMAGVGVGLGLGVAALTKAGADYQTMLSQLQANTTITNTEIGIVSAAILRMHSATGAPLQELADSFRHVTDAGYSVADAMQIVQQGTMSAVSTGASAADINNTLAITMHEFGMSAQQAAAAVNVLHLASAMSNTTMEQFATGTAKAQAFAANLGVSFTETEAALAALGRRFSASQSSTMFAGELVKIVAASKGAEKELHTLQQRTGIPLVMDFTQAGLQTRGFTQVQADLTKALQQTHTQMLNIIPATRGGLAAMVLGGSGAKDFATILGQLDDTMAGKTNPTLEAFNRQQHTLAGELADLRGAISTTAVTIGLQLVPEMTTMLRNMNPVISGVLGWAQAHAKLIAQLAPPIVIAVTTVGVAAALAGITAIAATLLSPLGLAIVSITLASGVLALAWTKNWFDMRRSVFDLQKDLDAFAKTLPTLGKTMDDIGKGNWAAVGKDINAFLGSPFMSPTAPNGQVYPLPWEPGGVFGPSTVPVPPAPPPLPVPDTVLRIPQPSLPTPLRTQGGAPVPVPVPVPVPPAVLPPIAQPTPTPVPTPLPLLPFGPGSAGGGMATPRPTALPLMPATGGGSSTVHVHATINVPIHTATGTVDDETRRSVAEGIASALKELAASGLSATPRASRLLPGARA